ncbi:transcription repressor NadR [Dialister succinatiphilus]|jgi:transcriptional regulator of NAD metabolism|uniref:transcription repressor NadR n=1 Tax=Dialister succinatiphilus TaxID=487173 RepID=UPI0026730E8C|nr:transcription repressor NadR [uncultured Dialister sp.]
MNGEERREKIAHILKEKQGKVRGSELARQMHVSRQVIVGDMALLKARGLPVVSTPRGYYLTEQEGKGYRKTLVCCHDRRHTAEELEMIISAGGMVHNVSVEHEVYGTLTAGLEIRNREDIRAFIERMKTKNAPLLSSMSGGIHSHLVETKEKEEMDRVEEALRKAGFLYEDRQVNL